MLKNILRKIGITSDVKVTTSSEPKEEIIKTPESKEDKLNKAKGLKKFYFGDQYVWAINEKNAKRKALRILSTQISEKNANTK